MLNDKNSRKKSSRGVLCKLDIFVGWIPLDISNICSGNIKTSTVVSKILNFTFYMILERKDFCAKQIVKKTSKKK